jgi:hypothetical protein
MTLALSEKPAGKAEGAGQSGPLFKPLKWPNQLRPNPDDLSHNPKNQYKIVVLS